MGLFFRVSKKVLHSFFFDTGFFTGKCTQIVQFGATYFTHFIYSDAVDERRFDGENSFYTDVVGHLTYCKTLFLTATRDADNNTAILLDTLFVTLFDAVCYGDGITTLKRGVLFTGSERLFGNFNQVHFLIAIKCLYET